jgi:hypothetical protein
VARAFAAQDVAALELLVVQKAGDGAFFHCACAAALWSRASTTLGCGARIIIVAIVPMLTAATVSIVVVVFAWHRRVEARRTSEWRFGTRC